MGFHTRGRGRTATAAAARPGATPGVTIAGRLTSRWDTPGTAASALRDGTVWAGYGGSTASLVASAVSLGLTNWPTPNAFLVRADGPTGDDLFSVLWVDLGTPSAGTSRYFRLYVAYLWADAHGAGTDGNLEHGIETADAALGGGDGLNPYMVPRNDGTFWLGYREISTGVRYIANDLRLIKGATYRLEWRIAYAAGTYTVEVRVYDAVGALIATAADFHQYTPVENRARLLRDATLTLTDREDHRWFRVGSNGPSSNYPLAGIASGNDFRAHGAVAVSDVDWCGAFGHVTGEAA